MQNNSSPKPIGLSFPLTLGKSGYFAQTYDNISQASASIVNLLNTRPGERPMNPLFGSRIYNYIFEQEIDNAVINQIINEEISFWVPNVNVQSVSINQSDTDIDNNTIYIIIDYSVGNGSITGSAMVQLNNNS